MPLGVDFYDVVLDGLLGDNATAGAPATLYAALFTADPGADDSGLEVSTSGTGYSRVAVTNNSTNFPAASGGAKTLATDIIWPTSTATWGYIKWVGFYDAASNGNLVFSARFSGGVKGQMPPVITPRINAGSLTISYWDLSA